MCRGTGCRGRTGTGTGKWWGPGVITGLTSRDSPLPPQVDDSLHSPQTPCGSRGSVPSSRPERKRRAESPGPGLGGVGGTSPARGDSGSDRGGLVDRDSDTDRETLPLQVCRNFGGTGVGAPPGPGFCSVLGRQSQRPWVVLSHSRPDGRPQNFLTSGRRGPPPGPDRSAARRWGSGLWGTRRPVAD